MIANKVLVGNAAEIIKSLTGTPCNDEEGNKIGVVEKVWVKSDVVTAKITLECGVSYLTTIMGDGKVKLEGKE